MYQNLLNFAGSKRCFASTLPTCNSAMKRFLPDLDSNSYSQYHRRVTMHALLTSQPAWPATLLCFPFLLIESRFCGFEYAVTMRQLLGQYCTRGSLRTQLQALPPSSGEPWSEPSFYPRLATSIKYPLIHALGSCGKLSSKVCLLNHSWL